MNIANKIINSGEGYEHINEEVCVASIDWHYGEDNTIYFCFSDGSYACHDQDKEEVKEITKDIFFTTKK